MSASGARSSGAGSALIFNLVSLVLFPVTLVGYIIWVGKGILMGKGSGVSGTAQGPLSARWTMHMFGIRPDEAAYRLMYALPGIPPLGLKLTSWPLMLAHRLSGYVPAAFRYPFEGEVPPGYEASARQTFFDGVVEKYLPEITQFVILGAGFDTRGFRLPEGSPVRTFEVDTPSTQAIKRAVLAQAGLDASRVTFAPADFEKDDWLAQLVAAGFDPRKPALFIWEGVIIYLERAAVEDTLRKVASTAKGSILAFDYFTSVVLESSGFYWAFARASTKAAGEPLVFGIDSTPPSRDRASELLSSCGLTLVETRVLGDETDGKRAWGGFAVAEVK